MKKFYLGVMIICGFLILGFNGVYAEEEVVLPELYIKAVNPGYTINGVGNVGELIEIGKNDSDARISLAGTTVSYTNSSGNTSVLLEFPENSWMTGESILLRLASSPDSELAALNYTKTLAMKGGLELIKDGVVLDNICWTGKTGCYKEFKSGSPTTLVRNKETGLFDLVADYEAIYDKESYFVESNDEEGYGEVPGHCNGLVFSELLSYYDVSKTEQFIELYNSNSEQILMDGCKLRYKNKDYSLSGILKPEGYFAYYPIDFSLTKNPTNGNLLELIDENGAKLDNLMYPNGQRKGTSYAFVGYDGEGKELWKTTYAPTPGKANNYQEFKTCEEGKVINEATGNCVKVTTVTEKICPDGQYLNILTGRCRKVTASKDKTCKEGYYLNPETGRCRKIVENKGADYSLKPEEYEESSSFVALFAVLGVIFLGIMYVVYEFRNEIKKWFKKIFRRK